MASEHSSTITIELDSEFAKGVISKLNRARVIRGMIYAVMFALLQFILSGCAEKKEIRADIATIQQDAQAAIGSFVMIAPNLEAVNPKSSAVITEFLSIHGEVLQRINAAAANYSLSTQQKQLSDESRAMLKDLREKSAAHAKFFVLQMRHMKSKDERDLNAQLSAHVRNLYALAADVERLALKLDPKAAKPAEPVPIQQQATPPPVPVIEPYGNL